MGTVVAIPGSIMESIMILKIALLPLKRSFSKPYAAMDAKIKLVATLTTVSPTVLIKYRPISTFWKTFLKCSIVTCEGSQERSV